MGNSQSTDRPQLELTPEQFTHELARRFADKIFTSLEIYSLKDNFKSLASTSSSVRYLSEDTLSRFLEIPDILGASPVVWQMVSFLAAFPFLKEGPAVLDLERLVIVVALLTKRCERVLKHGKTDRERLLFKSLTVYDRAVEREEEEIGRARERQKAESLGGGDGAKGKVKGFVIDMPIDDDVKDNYDDDDDLLLTNLNNLSLSSAIRAGDCPLKSSTFCHGMIPPDNFKRLIMLLLLIAPLGPKESLSQYTTQLTEVDGARLNRLKQIADSVVASFINVERVPGVRIGQWRRALKSGFPNLFDGFDGLFEHFLFSKNANFSKVKTGEESSKEGSTTAAMEIVQPVLPEEGEIMCIPLVSQLSFFLPKSHLFRRLKLLYQGNNDGFSMGSFETKIFHWRAPTILLVRGTRLADTPQSVQESNFLSSISAKRFPSGSKGDQLTFGVYITSPWKHTVQECFGETDSVLFQLEPVHDVFRASKINRDYVTFTKALSVTQTLSFGCPHPPATQATSTQSIGSLGAVSLRLDTGLEFGVFNHDYTARGGAFVTSEIRRFNFQDRFEIESLEVWGCGGDEEAKMQAERWAWEVREAEARRKINLGTGDIKSDRALLEMAGLIGGGVKSGGSMA